MGTKTQEYLAALAGEGELPEAGCCMTTTQSLIYDAAVRVNNLDEEVQEIKNNPDVVDIVATYADLQAYDTSTLTDKDIIRVLSDSTHGDMSTYYRYSTSTGEFTYIGGSAPNPAVVQTTGQSTTDVMSQKAVTDELGTMVEKSSFAFDDNTDTLTITVQE